MNKEIWKDIPKYEGRYAVSNFGRVWSLKKKKEGGILHWRINGCGYASACLQVCGNIKTIQIHRLVMMAFSDKYSDKFIVGHINGNKLDNRLVNLRLTNYNGNSQNRKGKKNTSSIYKGVWFHKANGKWRTAIKINGDSIFLGSYNVEKKAALAYDNAAIKYFGEYAKTNKMLGLT